MTQERSLIFAAYMAEAKNCFDGQILLSIFKQSLEKVQECHPEDKAMAAYFGGLVELRSSRLGDGDEEQAANLLAAASNMTVNSEDPTDISIYALSTVLGDVVCLTQLRFASPGQIVDKGDMDRIPSMGRGRK